MKVVSWMEGDELKLGAPCSMPIDGRMEVREFVREMWGASTPREVWAATTLTKRWYNDSNREARMHQRGVWRDRYMLPGLVKELAMDILKPVGWERWEVLGRKEPEALYTVAELHDELGGIAGQMSASSGEENWYVDDEADATVWRKDVLQAINNSVQGSVSDGKAAIAPAELWSMVCTGTSTAVSTNGVETHAQRHGTVRKNAQEIMGPGDRVRNRKWKAVQGRIYGGGGEGLADDSGD